MEEVTGLLVVERVRGKSTVTRCFSKYPLKFIIPNKVGPSAIDAVWIYSLSYGGGIVSGDHINCSISVGDECTAILTTQASTKVYKSLGLKCSEQVLEARIGCNALLVSIPDPITCFASARYIQKQVFNVLPDSNLIVVDWLTSGRHERGERWSFHLYRSSNIIFAGGLPLFIDSTFLGEDSQFGTAESMHDYQVIAMLIVLGPKLNQIRTRIQEQVKTMMSRKYHASGASRYRMNSSSDDEHGPRGPTFIASCSAFGPKSAGLVVRIAASTTESVYDFLRNQLASLEPIIGVIPYR